MLRHIFTLLSISYYSKTVECPLHSPNHIAIYCIQCKHWSNWPFFTKIPFPIWYHTTNSGYIFGWWQTSKRSRPTKSVMSIVNFYTMNIILFSMTSSFILGNIFGRLTDQYFGFGPNYKKKLFLTSLTFLDFQCVCGQT